MRSVLKVAALGVLMATLAGCDLAITKTADPDPAFVGKRLAYTIEVTNLETTNPPSEYGQTVPNATVLDRLPDSVEFVSANPSQGECAPADAENRVLCNLGALEGEQSETVRIVVTPTEAGKIRNTAETQACLPGAMAGIDEENGELICLGEGGSPASNGENLSEEQLTTLRGTAGIVGPPSEDTCEFNDCDPQENNTVTITTTVRDAPDANACTITGTPGNDILDGTPGRDVICGLGGNDIIRGAGGNDVLRGGIGNDVIYGEVGDDTILGEAGNDTVRGGDGNDRIEGAEGKDALYGERGNDTILGGIGNDALRGGPGQDSLNGGPGKNSVKQ